MYKTYDAYSKDSSFSAICSVKKNAIKNINYLKVSCKSDSCKNIWGINYEDEIWVKNKRKGKFYELKKDSLGLYYDIYNNEEVRGGTIIGSVAVGLVTSTIPLYNQKPIGGITDVTLRYRQDTVTTKFYPYSFPHLKPSKVIYYFSKYSKNETLIRIEVDKKVVTLKKGSYYEEVLPAKPPFSKKGIYLEQQTPFKIGVFPTKTTIILFNRKKNGVVNIETMNKHMVLDFLKRKDRLEQVHF